MLSRQEPLAYALKVHHTVKLFHGFERMTEGLIPAHLDDDHFVADVHLTVSRRGVRRGFLV